VNWQEARNLLSSGTPVRHTSWAPGKRLERATDISAVRLYDREKACWEWSSAYAIDPDVLLDGPGDWEAYQAPILLKEMPPPLPTENMSFLEAIEAMKLGALISHEDWSVHQFFTVLCIKAPMEGGYPIIMERLNGHPDELRPWRGLFPYGPSLHGRGWHVVKADENGVVPDGASNCEKLRQILTDGKKARPAGGPSGYWLGLRHETGKWYVDVVENGDIVNSIPEGEFWPKAWHSIQWETVPDDPEANSPVE
jgi:hypothetical protein